MAKRELFWNQVIRYSVVPCRSGSEVVGFIGKRKQVMNVIGAR